MADLLLCVVCKKRSLRALCISSIVDFMASRSLLGSLSSLFPKSAFEFMHLSDHYCGMSNEKTASLLCLHGTQNLLDISLLPRR